MRRLAVFTLFLVFFLSFSVSAIDGHVQLDYAVENETGEGTLYLCESFDELLLAGKLTTGLSDFGLRNTVIPTAEPNYQKYEFIAELELTPRMSAVFSEEWIYGFNDDFADSKATKIGMRYDF